MKLAEPSTVFSWWSPRTVIRHLEVFPGSRHQRHSAPQRRVQRRWTLKTWGISYDTISQWKSDDNPWGLGIMWVKQCYKPTHFPGNGKFIPPIKMVMVTIGYPQSKTKPKTQRFSVREPQLALSRTRGSMGSILGPNGPTWVIVDPKWWRRGYRFFNAHFQAKQLLQSRTHDGSMVLVYIYICMLTWLGYIDGKCYHIYI